MAYTRFTAFHLCIFRHDIAFPFFRIITMTITNYSKTMFAGIIFSYRLLQIRISCIIIDIFLTRSFALILFVIQILSKDYLKKIPWK